MPSAESKASLSLARFEVSPWEAGEAERGVDDWKQESEVVSRKISLFPTRNTSSTYPGRPFLGVNPSFFTNPSIILLLLPGVKGTGAGTGGISSSTSILSVSSLFLDRALFLLLIDSLDFLDLQNPESSATLSSEELFHRDWDTVG